MLIIKCFTPYLLRALEWKINQIVVDKSPVCRYNCATFLDIHIFAIHCLFVDGFYLGLDNNELSILTLLPYVLINSTVGSLVFWGISIVTGYLAPNLEQVRRLFAG